MAGILVEHTRQHIRDLSIPISSVLGLRELSHHADIVLFSALAFWGIQILVAPAFGRRILGRDKWSTWKRKERNNWNIRVVSFAHAVVIVPLAWMCLGLPALTDDKAYGWDPRVGNIAAIASGYFLWDTVESLVHFSDIGFVVHGLSCFLIYLLTFKPFIAYYGPRFLLWELSTPFLNIHWFLDKVNMTSSPAQLVNGLFLLGSFASARLVYGVYMSYEFWQTLSQIRNEVPLTICLVYGVGNILLNGLNWFWFTKMIAALRKRLVPSGAHKNKKHANGHVNGVNGGMKKS